MNHLNFNIHTVLADLAAIVGIIYAPFVAFSAHFEGQKKTKRLALQLLIIATILFVVATTLYFVVFDYKYAPVVHVKSVPIQIPSKVLSIPYPLMGVNGYSIGRIPILYICSWFALFFNVILFSIDFVFQSLRRNRSYLIFRN